MTKLQQLQGMLAPVVEALGFQCWGIELISQGRYSVLRIYIDHENGIHVDDCEQVSRQLSAVLDVEDPISTEYTLEVSSPGMERPLFTEQQYVACIGQQVRVRLRAPIENQRNFKGAIRGIEEGDLVIQVDEYEYLLPFELIEKANIVPVFD